MSETRKLSSLRGHPENANIFGDPEESEQFDAILTSIRKYGIWEPLIVKADGTILAGHLRRLCAEKLKLKEVPVRVHEGFDSYRDEVSFVIRSNTDRRQLTKAELAMAFKRLRNLPASEGGAKKKQGRPAKGAASGTVSGTKSRDAAAEVLGIGRHEAEALETVFTTPGVPEELKRSVNAGTVAPTPAAKAVRAELKRQGGKIRDTTALMPAAVRPPKATPPEKSGHDRRVDDLAERYRVEYRKLFELYKQIDAVLTRCPLKSVIGPTEHHEYASLVRDLAVRAWREIESVQGPTESGKQMTLTVLAGGRDG